jgi:polyphosphate kinase
VVQVLALALDTSVPLLERLRFLAITARNLD